MRTFRLLFTSLKSADDEGYRMFPRRSLGIDKETFNELEVLATTQKGLIGGWRAIGRWGIYYRTGVGDAKVVDQAQRPVTPFSFLVIPWTVEHATVEPLWSRPIDSLPWLTHAEAARANAQGELLIHEVEIESLELDAQTGEKLVEWMGRNADRLLGVLQDLERNSYSKIERRFDDLAQLLLALGVVLPPAMRRRLEVRWKFLQGEKWEIECTVTPESAPQYGHKRSEPARSRQQPPSDSHEAGKLLKHLELAKDRKAFWQAFDWLRSSGEADWRKRMGMPQASLKVLGGW